MTTRAPLAVALTLAGSLALAACATGPAAGPEPLTPTSRWTLQVQPGVDQIALAVREDGLAAAPMAPLRELVEGHG